MLVSAGTERLQITKELDQVTRGLDRMMRAVEARRME